MPRRTFTRSATRAALASLAALTSIVAAGCDPGEARLPDGEPLAVVRAAPARTSSEKTARVVVAYRDGSAEGTIDLTADASTLQVRRADAPPATVRVGPATYADGLRPDDPILALDLLRGAIDARPSGGVQVRGVDALRYEVTVDLARVDLPQAVRLDRESLPAQVFVDEDGRARRVVMARDLATSPSTLLGRDPPPLVSIDYFDFGIDQN